MWSSLPSSSVRERDELFSSKHSVIWTTLGRYVFSRPPSLWGRKGGGVQDGLGLCRCAVWFYDAHSERVSQTQPGGYWVLSPVWVSSSCWKSPPLVNWASLLLTGMYTSSSNAQSSRVPGSVMEWTALQGSSSPRIRTSLKASGGRTRVMSQPCSHFPRKVIRFPLNADVFSLPESGGRRVGAGECWEGFSIGALSASEKAVCFHPRSVGDHHLSQNSCPKADKARRWGWRERGSSWTLLLAWHGYHRQQCKDASGGLELAQLVKNACHQACWPDFHLHDPHSGNREQTPVSYQLCSVHVLHYTCVHMHTHMQQ